LSVRLLDAGDREGASLRDHLPPDDAGNIASLEESLWMSRFETASETANTNTAQSSVR
jgi:hypothetical protein